MIRWQESSGLCPMTGHFRWRMSKTAFLYLTGLLPSRPPRDIRRDHNRECPGALLGERPGTCLREHPRTRSRELGGSHPVKMDPAGTLGQAFAGYPGHGIISAASADAEAGAVAGIDINVEEAWDLYGKGTGRW